MGIRRRSVQSGLILGLIASPLIGQHIVTIKPDTVKRSSSLANVPIVAPIRCDDSGSLYYREFTPGDGSRSLVSLKNDAQTVTTFDLSRASIDSVHIASARGFAVSPNGSVFQVVMDDNDHVYILRFDADGSYEGVIKLDIDFWPQDLATIGGQSFICSGTQVLRTGPVTRFEPFVALFDQSGRFIKNVEPNVPSAPNSQNRSQSVATNAPLGRLEVGALESGDGVAYLLRQTKQPVILVISAAGTIDRQFNLEAPQGMKISSFKAGAGKLVVEYMDSKGGDNSRVLFSTYDSLDGTKLLDYEPAPELAAGFACYDFKRTFSFVSADQQGYRTLVTGVAR